VWHAGVDRRGRRGAASGALCASAWGWAREAAADHARTEPALAPATVAASSSPRVATLTLPDTHLLVADAFLHALAAQVFPRTPLRPSPLRPERGEQGQLGKNRLFACYRHRALVLAPQSWQKNFNLNPG